MSEKYKIILVTIVLLMSFFSGWLVSGRITTNRYNKTIAEYRNTIDEFERQLTAEGERYQLLISSNSRLQKQITDNIRRAERAEELVGAISTGLSSDVTNLDGIIKTIRNLRERIEEYNKNQKLSN